MNHILKSIFWGVMLAIAFYIVIIILSFFGVITVNADTTFLQFLI